VKLSSSIVAGNSITFTNELTSTEEDGEHKYSPWDLKEILCCLHKDVTSATSYERSDYLDV
jgi:hypothetical protein